MLYSLRDTIGHFTRQEKNENQYLLRENLSYLLLAPALPMRKGIKRLD